MSYPVYEKGKEMCAASESVSHGKIVTPCENKPLSNIHASGFIGKGKGTMRGDCGTCRRVTFFDHVREGFFICTGCGLERPDAAGADDTHKEICDDCWGQREQNEAEANDLVGAKVIAKAMDVVMKGSGKGGAMMTAASACKCGDPAQASSGLCWACQRVASPTRERHTCSVSPEAPLQLGCKACDAHAGHSPVDLDMPF